LTYESEDFCFASPVRERRASARERLLSYREPASRNPQDVHPETRLGNPCTRAPFRLLSIRAPRQAELRTSSRLAPSYHHPALRPNGREDTRCDRPMSATHTNYVHPHLARFQLALAAFAAGTPHRVLGSVALTGGPSVSRHPRPLRRIVMRALFSNLLPHGLLVTSVGVFFPRR
jgi:hypothetical protein